jgi:predicted DNA-binding transcriptional regulator AlpA
MQRYVCIPVFYTMTPLLTPETLAQKLCLSTQTIYNRLAKRVDLPVHLKIGRLPRWREIDVDDWLAAKVEPAQVAVLCSLRRRGRPTKAEQMAARRD